MSSQSLVIGFLCLIFLALLLMQAPQAVRPGLSGAATVATPTPATTVTSYLIGTYPTEVPSSGNRVDLWPGAEICNDYHAGAYDWCAPLGTEVRSRFDCTFLTQGVYTDNPRYGAYIMCNTDSGLEVYVGHMDMETVNPLGFRPGDRIQAGQTIGYVGWHFIMYHVHTQLRRNGVLVSAENWWWEWNNG